ncbi:MAG: hypothetical protein ACSHYF_11220 [Verrucomicrobiaceae bacterium]
MRPSLHLLLLGTLPLTSTTIEWNGEGEDLAGNPLPNYHTKENWDSDTVPTGTDDVRIFTPGSPDPIFLSNTSATVNTIDCRVPFSLGETLIINSSGTFENSLIATRTGTIRGLGPVIFKGQNDLTRVRLEGSSHFTNQGIISIGTRGIHPGTLFFNQSVFSLASGSTTLGIFNNDGLLSLGASGTINSSSTVTNHSVIQKNDATELSKISGNLIQLDGQIFVTEGAQLNIDGVVHQYKGGILKSDGTLILTQVQGGIPTRTFDGLTEVSGSGTVNQVQEFELLQDLTLNMPNAPGYEIGGLIFGRLDPPAPATLTNAGQVLMKGSDNFVPNDPTDASSLFLNQAGASVTQDPFSQPAFAIPVENHGNWLCYGMNVYYFENNGTLHIEGSDSINPEDPTVDSTLHNKGSGQITFGESGFTNYLVKVKYNQDKGAKTEIKNGLVALEQGSNAFNGTFDLGSSERLTIKNGTFRITDPFLTLKGTGTTTIGGSQLNPEITLDVETDEGSPFATTAIINELGIDANGLIDDSRGLIFRSGSVNIPAGRIMNKGYFDWNGGSIIATEFENLSRLDISPGAHKSLRGQLTNFPQLFVNNSVEIFQNASLELAPATEGDDFSGGRIVNGGTHHLRSGASISGGGEKAYQNNSTLICEEGANVIISSPFTNERGGTVKVTGNSVLHLTEPRNLSSEDGTLEGGNWKVDPDARLLFNEDVTQLRDANWEGSDLNKVHSVIGEATSLYRDSSITHSEPLTVSQGATFGLRNDCVVTVDHCTFASGALFVGNGTINGDLTLNDGTIAPGESPGTLIINGNTTFSPTSLYQWEASSLNDSDFLNIDGPLSLAGTFRPHLLDSYLPTPGSPFLILVANSISGTFDTLDLAAIPPQLTATLSYHDPTGVTLVFNDHPAPTFDSWKSAHFTPAEQADSLISGPTADPDADGLSNLAEFAHGTNPKQGNASPVSLLAVSPETIRLQFPWAAGPHALFTGQTSTGLDNFLPANTTVISRTPGSGDTENITIEIPRPAPHSGFARLLISLQ